MPHMINKDLVEEMQKLWPAEWEQTSRNRFRKSNDMQYGFSYFYYLTYRRELQLGLNKGKFEYFDEGKAGRELVRMIWEDEIDTNGDGRMNRNELLSLAALAAGDSPKPAYVLELEDCLMGVNRTKEKVDYGTKSLFTNETVIGFDEVKSCPLSFDGMKNFAVKVGGGNRHKDALVTNLDEVAFQMIGDDYNDTKAQLDSVRARRTKFICINDNMENPSDEVIDLFQDFLESFFPKPSSFELTDGRANQYLRLEEVEEVRAKVVMVWNCCLVVVGVLVVVGGLVVRGRGGGEGGGGEGRGGKAKEN